MKSIIVVIAYNRPLSTKRLISTLTSAEYFYDDQIDLILSIDKSDSQSKIYSDNENLSWTHGRFQIIKHEERMGLRNHVLFCGDLSKEYDLSIFLEDDLTVSKSFYSYSRQAIEFYGDNQKIAGISLYRHYTNIPVLRPFEPLNNGFDTFLLQYAQSWGQCYNFRMWNSFRKFYDQFIKENQDLSKLDLPSNIKKWSNKSWLKYYMAYIHINSLFFVYPYVSLSTNHSEVGEHNTSINSDYMVPIQYKKDIYSFANFDQSIKYDMFFEYLNPKELIGDEFLEKKIEIDLYGYKEKFDADILFSTKKRDFLIIKELKLKYRPHELNLVYPESGYGIYIYDLHIQKRNIKKSNHSTIVKYDIKSRKISDIAIYFYREILNRLSRK